MKEPSETKVIGFPLKPNYYQTTPLHAEMLDTLTGEALSYPYLIELHGESGIGKATLACAVAQEARSHYRWVAHIDLSTVASMTQSIYKIVTQQRKANTRIKSKKEAWQAFETLVQEEGPWLLVVDNVSNPQKQALFDAVENTEGVIIVTSTEAFASSQASTATNFISKKVTPLTVEASKALVTACIPPNRVKALETTDWETLYKQSQGFPYILVELAKEFTFSLYPTFQDFLDAQGILQLEGFLERQAKAIIGHLHRSTEKRDERALTCLYQMLFVDAAFAIPFSLFKDGVQNIGLKQLSTDTSLIVMDTHHQTCHVSPAFQVAMRGCLTSSGADTVIIHTAKHLYSVFDYLVINDYKKDCGVLLAFLPHVEHFLRYIQTESIDAKSLGIEKELLYLSCSVGRFYYRFEEDFKKALEWFGHSQHWIEQYLSTSDIDTYSKDPVHFSSTPVSADIATYLLLYAREVLFQQGTIRSQQVSRKEDSELEKVIEILKQSYCIQKNLKAEVIPIAYTVRNLLRALRKARGVQDSEYKQFVTVLQGLLQDIPAVAQQVKMELRSDIGIALKEMEMQKPAEKDKDYSYAIDALWQVYQTGSPNQAAMLLLHLGEAFLLAHQSRNVRQDNPLWKGLTAYMEALNKVGTSSVRYAARLYYELARACYMNQWFSLAEICIQQALPLQKSFYGDAHERVRRTEELQGAIQKSIAQATIIPVASVSPKIGLMLEEAGNNYKGAALAYLNDLFQQGFALTDEQEIATRLQTLAQLNNALQYLCQTRAQERNLTSETEGLSERTVLLEKAEAQEKQKETNTATKETLWDRTFQHDVVLVGASAEFARYFRKYLFKSMEEKIRLALKETTKMDRGELAGNIIQGLAFLLPKVSATTAGPSFEVDLPRAVREVAKTLVDSHARSKQVAAENVMQSFHTAVNEEMDTLITELNTIMQHVSAHVARCYSPLLIPLKKEDIQKLAKKGAKAVMHQQKSSLQFSKKPLEEVVMQALRKGSYKGTLHYKTTATWSVHGFFAKPGIEIYGETPAKICIPDLRATRPGMYHYRYGSLRELAYYQQKRSSCFFNTKKAAEEAVKANQESCLMM